MHVGCSMLTESNSFPRDQKAVVRTDGSARHFHKADLSKLENHIGQKSSVTPSQK